MGVCGDLRDIWTVAALTEKASKRYGRLMAIGNPGLAMTGGVLRISGMCSNLRPVAGSSISKSGSGMQHLANGDMHDSTLAPAPRHCSVNTVAVGRPRVLCGMPVASRLDEHSSFSADTRIDLACSRRCESARGKASLRPAPSFPIAMKIVLKPFRDAAGAFAKAALCKRYVPLCIGIP